MTRSREEAKEAARAVVQANPTAGGSRGIHQPAVKAPQATAGMHRRAAAVEGVNFQGERTK
jgi:hypothetical protein